MTIPTQSLLDLPDGAKYSAQNGRASIEAERQGTEYALYVNRRMNQTIIMPEVNAYTLGQLMFLLEMTTAYEGELLNIDAFNQPGVETSKRATYAILGNTDAKYDAARKEMTGRPAFKPEYIL